MFFVLFLLDDRRIRIRSRTSYKWIRIREAQKHTDPDPQHWFKQAQAGAPDPHWLDKSKAN
jgi:hypothetical protein